MPAAEKAAIPDVSYYWLRGATPQFSTTPGVDQTLNAGDDATSDAGNKIAPRTREDVVNLEQAVQFVTEEGKNDDR